MPPKTCPQANLMEEFSQLRSLFSMILTPIKLTKSCPTQRSSSEVGHGLYYLWKADLKPQIPENTKG